MMGKTHQVVGATLSATGLLLAGIPPVSVAFAVGVGIGWIASVLPDIDGDPRSGDPVVRKILGVGNRQTNRKIGRAVQHLAKAKNGARFTAALFELVFALIAKLIALIINIFARLISHRGMTHWGITWFSLTALLLVLSLAFQETAVQLFEYPAWKVVALPFFVGYGSHILCDMATRSGIAILGPISSKPYHILPRGFRLKTGSWQEFVFMVAWIGVVTPVALALIYVFKGNTW